MIFLDQGNSPLTLGIESKIRVPSKFIVPSEFSLDQFFLCSTSFHKMGNMLFLKGPESGAKDCDERGLQNCQLE